jgi:site-specific DNA recombinase
MDVLILARVSSDDSGIERSVDEQIHECEAWAAREGWRVVHTIRELGSASMYSQRKNRDEWDEALNWIRSGRVNALITWEMSRATRELETYAELRKACMQHNVRWGYGGTLFDLSDRNDRFRTGLDALLAEDEVSRTSERIRRAVAANVAAGKPNGKNTWGYQRIYDSQTKALLSIVPDPETGPLVQEIFRRYLEGEPVNAIARDLTRRGVPPRRPKRTTDTVRTWESTAIKQILATAAYAGLRTHNGEVVGTAIWPALIEESTYYDVQRRLADPSRRRELMSWNPNSLLSGIARCGHGDCNARMRGGYNNRRYKDFTGEGRLRFRSYVCAVGSHVTMKEAWVDAIVERYVIARMSRPDCLEQLYITEGVGIERRQQLLAEINDHQDWLDQVKVRAAAERKLDLFFDQNALVQPKIAAAQQELKRLATANPVVLELASSNNVAATWADMPLHTQREVVRALADVRIVRAQRGGRSPGLMSAAKRVNVTWALDS